LERTESKAITDWIIGIIVGYHNCFMILFLNVSSFISDGFI